jgi:hypothetical protein
MQSEQAALLDAQSSADAHAESVAIYRVLKSGRMPNRRNPVVRFYEKICFGLSECWYWRGSRNRLGYGVIPMMGENKAHRVSWLLHRGPIPAGMNVLHKCDVRACVNPDHLFLGTQADNVSDMVAKGRNVSIPRFGEDNPMSKLTKGCVSQIRAKYADGGTTMNELAREYGVSVMTVQRAIARKTWEIVQ